MKRNLHALMNDMIDSLMVIRNLESIENNRTIVTATVTEANVNEYISDNEFLFLVEIRKAKDDYLSKYDILTTLAFYDNTNADGNVIRYNVTFKSYFKEEYEEIDTWTRFEKIVNDTATVANRAVLLCTVNDSPYRDLLSKDVYSTDVIDKRIDNVGILVTETFDVNHTYDDVYEYKMIWRMK